MVQKRKSRAFNPRYESPNQGTLLGFEHPFERELDMSNRWVVLSKLIPWDELCNIYYHQVGYYAPPKLKCHRCAAIHSLGDMPYVSLNSILK
jgi:hypothetical protein